MSSTPTVHEIHVEKLGCVPFFSRDQKSAEAIIQKFTCGCGALLDVKYTAKTITSETQMRIRCQSCAYRKKFKPFCPICLTTIDGENDGPMLTHFLEHCKLINWSLFHAKRPQLLATTCKCPFDHCNNVFGFKELLPHIQQEIYSVCFFRFCVIVIK